MLKKSALKLLFLGLYFRRFNETLSAYPTSHSGTYSWVRCAGSHFSTCWMFWTRSLRTSCRVQMCWSAAQSWSTRVSWLEWSDKVKCSSAASSCLTTSWSTARKTSCAETCCTTEAGWTWTRQRWWTSPTGGTRIWVWPWGTLCGCVTPTLWSLRVCCAAGRSRTSRGGYRPSPRRETGLKRTKKWVRPSEYKQLLWTDVGTWMHLISCHILEMFSVFIAGMDITEEQRKQAIFKARRPKHGKKGRKIFDFNLFLSFTSDLTLYFLFTPLALGYTGSVPPHHQNLPPLQQRHVNIPTSVPQQQVFFLAEPPKRKSYHLLYSITRNAFFRKWCFIFLPLFFLCSFRAYLKCPEVSKTL